MPTARQQVAANLKPLLPKGWVLVDYMTDFDTITKPTVMLQVTEIGKFPQAPLGYLLVSFEATVLAPSTDPSRVWGLLDDQVIQVIHDLQTIDGLDFQTAEPVVHSNHFGFVIRFTVPANKE